MVLIFSLSASPRGSSRHPHVPQRFPSGPSAIPDKVSRRSRAEQSPETAVSSAMSVAAAASCAPPHCDKDQKMLSPPPPPASSQEKSFSSSRNRQHQTSISSAALFAPGQLCLQKRPSTTQTDTSTVTQSCSWGGQEEPAKRPAESLCTPAGSEASLFIPAPPPTPMGWG